MNLFQVTLIIWTKTMLKLVSDRVFCFQKHALYILYKSQKWCRDINSFQTFSGLYGMIVPSMPPRILENRPAQPLHIPCSSLGHVPLGTTSSMLVWLRCYGISIIIHDGCYKYYICKYVLLNISMSITIYYCRHHIYSLWIILFVDIFFGWQATKSWIRKYEQSSDLMVTAGPVSTCLWWAFSMSQSFGFHASN